MKYQCVLRLFFSLSPSPNDAKIIKVASSALGAKGFFKAQDDTAYTVSVPDRPKDSVSKPAENTILLFQAPQHTKQTDSCS